MNKKIFKSVLTITGVITIAYFMFGCKPKKVDSAISGNAAEKVYVAPGKKDELYLFTSGGFSGQIGVYGLPSGRLLKEMGVFSADPQTGYGFSEETKGMLNTSHGWVPWDDSHHPQLSKTDGNADGRWIFINANNTPRIARSSLSTFRTEEIIELPNCGGNHASPFLTQNTEYVVGASRFSVPYDKDGEAPIAEYKDKFKGTVSFVKVDPKSGRMNLSFQLLVPGVDYDLSRAGKAKSHGWVFLSCYNTEKAHTLLEVGASQRDKDFIMAVNWKKAEEYLSAGKASTMPVKYAHNYWDENTQNTISEMVNTVNVLDVKDLPGICYYIPCPKSPHGCDVDPTGEYIAASGKLAAVVPVYSFSKILKAIESKDYEGNFDGIPVIKYESALKGEVEKPGLGPLHTEFDGKGNAYTSFFVSSEIVKWKVETQEILDRVPTYYSIGHLCVPEGDCINPLGKYVIALNKITKDRYLPTGPELTQSAQLYDISGDKMKLLLDFPTVGEPHYAQACAAEKIVKNEKRFYKLSENNHKYVTKLEKDAKVVREGINIHIYMTSMRSHFVPDNIEGVKLGDVVYFHVTNLEQDWDVPHGFTIKGASNAELLIMPGETQTYKWTPDRVGIFPFYCTDFCSALHQEMQGYVRVSPSGSATPIKFSTGEETN
ncbi:MAG: Sec-dependent nitrous-oxide reductase [Flavobacteriales bacterium]|nr:Sec-dependent nitrous-oxide reductase [Flavobacteriales bacterium]